MSTGFMKGAAVGVVCALLGGLGSVALAGSGVGAVFNLGKTNSVNAKSSLTGSSATPLLNVVNAHGVGVMGQSKIATQPALEGLNTSGGPGGAFVVNSGVAPFTVSNATKVTNLNADLLDGLDSTALLTHAYAEPTAFQVQRPDDHLRNSDEHDGTRRLVRGHVHHEHRQSGSADDTACYVYSPASNEFAAAYGNTGTSNAQSTLSATGLLSTTGGAITVQCADCHQRNAVYFPSLVAIRVGAVSGAVATVRRHAPIARGLTP